MQLSKQVLAQIEANPSLDVPDINVFELSEKVLQFGTGVLLRGLPDYFIDKANKQGVFNGRVVVIKTTQSDSSAFDKQDGLYTVCVRGVENGNIVEQNIINASISRVLNANTEWEKILACAHNPEMQIVFSNTTEVGIQLTDDLVDNNPPTSYPGKLLAFLFERFKAFKGSAESGMIIVPTELITDNGSKLESILLELAHRNNLDYTFIEWLETNNTFCNSLVDRIVPGKPDKATLQKLETELGYTDALLTMTEVFSLWAIEGDEKTKERLSFYKTDDAVVITPDITLFKELKLRLLNGTHTFNCGLAFLGGFNITREAVTDKTFSVFAKNLMHTEIANAIPVEIDNKVKKDFANAVFERFCNPFIDHQWISITAQYTSKMKMRNVPLLLQHYTTTHVVPMHMATGFAGFLLFMKAIKFVNGKYIGENNEIDYVITDDAASYFYTAWQQHSPAELAKTVMENEEMWDTDLTKLPGFLQAVQEQLAGIMENGVLLTIAALERKKEIA